ncbi:MAG TPA: ABC transporter permease [Vicinamibacterales bacterium]|nr:ABC transporter permease [Vicinamibacterales bacterium]
MPALIEIVRRDFRTGFRALAKEKTFSALAVSVLALGICGVTTMFSVVNGVMLRGFDFPNADRLVSANLIDPTTATAFGVNGQISSMDYEELRAAQQSLELMAAYLSGSTVNVTIDGRPQRYTGVYTTEDFLRILGVSPHIGRDLTAADNQPGAEKVALVGYGLWQREFGGSPEVVGRVVRINGKPATIIGVMPQGFAFPTNEELWIPLYTEFPVRPRNDPAAISPGVIGLIKRGVSTDQATAEFTELARRFATAYPETNKRFNTGRVEPLIQTFTPTPLRGTLLTMLAFCVGVLLIACANVMNMQFARATERGKELAIRSALGASRMRLVRQMLTESLLLSTVGAVVGIALAYGAIDWLTAAVRSLDTPPPSWITFDLSMPVLAVTVAATVAAAVASGLLPALGLSRTRAVDILRDSTRGATSRRISLLSRGLVVLQIVVTCVLLIGALLQVRTIRAQQTIDFGYDTTGILSARMGLMDGDYPSSQARKQFYDRLIETLSTEPEISAAAFTNRFRMVFSGSGPIEIEGRQYVQDQDRPNTNFEQVTGGFFDVTGQKLLEGRPFTTEDLDTRQPVAIVNTAFARKHFGAESALGRRFRTFGGTTNEAGPWRTIVGVVSDARMLGPFNNPGLDESGFYVPFYASVFGPTPPEPLANQFATVIVRPRGGSAEALAAPLRRAIARLDPNLPLYYVGPPQSQIDAFISQNKIIATMFSMFGAVAVLLAAAGIYGVMSFAVSQRTQELGVRMALGATRRRVLTMVLAQGAIQVIIGTIAGTVLALAIATLAGTGIQSVLFGVSPRDPVVYSTVVLLVAVVSAVAILVPARRATRVDPVIALRAE